MVTDPETLGEALPREMVEAVQLAHDKDREITAYEALWEAATRRAESAESKLTEQIQANEALMAANRSLAGKLADATSRAETSETLFEKAHLNCSHAEARLLETKQRLAAELAKRVHLENEANALRWDLELVASGSATQQETERIREYLDGNYPAATPAPLPEARQEHGWAKCSALPSWLRAVVEAADRMRNDGVWLPPEYASGPTGAATDYDAARAKLKETTHE